MSSWHVIGGMTFDLLAHDLPTLPRTDAAGDEFTLASLVHLPAPFVCSVGGNAGNAAFVAARLGCHVRLVTGFADDIFGGWLRERFTDAGVELVRVRPSETSINVVATDARGRRTSLFRPVHLDVADLCAAARPIRFSPGDVVLVAGYPHPEVAAILPWVQPAAASGALVALDVGPVAARLTAAALAEALPALDLVFANHLELEALVPGLEPLAAARRIAEQHDLAVVAKAGAAGVTYVTADSQVATPAFPVDATGPTVGAGDAFNAGFLTASVQGVEPLEALQFGAAVAALVVQRSQGVLGAPTRGAVAQLLATHTPPSPRSGP